MSDTPYVVVVGGANMDIAGRATGKLVPRDSNLGTVRLMPGGVGRNIAHNLALLGVDVHLVTCFGQDAQADALVESCTEAGIEAARRLEDMTIRTNVTLVFSAAQAILPAKNGSAFVSPFIGWKEANGEDCRRYIKDIVDIYKNYGYYGKTQIICAAVRTPKQIVDCAVSGADIVTAGLSVFEAAFRHPYTRQGLDTFCDAWDHTAKE